MTSHSLRARVDELEQVLTDYAETLNPDDFSITMGEELGLTEGEVREVWNREARGWPSCVEVATRMIMGLHDAADRKSETGSADG